jgi:hypothetical protein
MVIIFFALWFGFGLIGFILGFIGLIIPIYFVFRRIEKYTKDTEEKRKKIGKQNYIFLLAMIIITTFLVDHIDFGRLSNSNSDDKEDWSIEISDSVSPQHNEFDGEQEITNSDKPYKGMAEKDIDFTQWGPPNEQKVMSDTMGVEALQLDAQTRIVDYYWYDCHDGMQFTRHVETLRGEVTTVEDEPGIDIDDISYQFRKCTK